MEELKNIRYKKKLINNIEIEYYEARDRGDDVSEYIDLLNFLKDNILPDDFDVESTKYADSLLGYLFTEMDDFLNDYL